ncbi:hypothetical protein NPIL_522561 [Nephila pilipes]|uniref:Uncharacterized protein n=1 Tax=Nephila pilipes TaxID=299642 RepID=A0A8X6QK56_NEPPI|nr:hypothetical protein NPIL_522561 [Nephila pilipes]
MPSEKKSVDADLRFGCFPTSGVVSSLEDSFRETKHESLTREGLGYEKDDISLHLNFFQNPHAFFFAAWGAEFSNLLLLDGFSSCSASSICLRPFSNMLHHFAVAK